MQNERNSPVDIPSVEKHILQFYNNKIELVFEQKLTPNIQHYNLCFKQSTVTLISNIATARERKSRSNVESSSNLLPLTGTINPLFSRLLNRSFTRVQQP